MPVSLVALHWLASSAVSPSCRFCWFVRVVLVFFAVSCCLFFGTCLSLAPPFVWFVRCPGCVWLSCSLAFALSSLPSPLAYGGADYSGSAGPTPCYRNGPSVWPVGTVSCFLVLLPAGPEMEYALFPFATVLYGNKGFGPVWGTALYTMLCLSIVFLGVPLLSRPLHYAGPHVTTPYAVVQRVSPLLWRILLNSLTVLLCPSWALLRSAAPGFGVCRHWRGLLFCLFPVCCVLAVLSPLRLNQ